MVHFRVVKAVEQMDRARSRRGDANADLPRELRVRAGHEGRHLFVPRLDELHAILRAIERAENAVDAITGISVQAPDPPVRESFEKKIRNGLSHESPFSNAIQTLFRER